MFTRGYVKGLVPLGDLPEESPHSWASQRGFVNGFTERVLWLLLGTFGKSSANDFGMGNSLSV